MQGRIFYIICGYSSGKSLSFYPVNLTNWEKLSFFGHFYPGRVYDFLENIRPCLNVRLDVNLTYCLGNFVPVMLSTNPSCCTAKRLNSPLGKNKEKGGKVLASLPLVVSMSATKNVISIVDYFVLPQWAT